jgi:hypothetical protein
MYDQAVNLTLRTNQTLRTCNRAGEKEEIETKKQRHKRKCRRECRKRTDKTRRQNAQQHPSCIALRRHLGICMPNKPEIQTSSPSLRNIGHADRGKTRQRRGSVNLASMATLITEKSPETSPAIHGKMRVGWEKKKRSACKRLRPDKPQEGAGCAQSQESAARA